MTGGDNALEYTWKTTRYEVHLDLMLQQNMTTFCQRRILRSEI